MNDWRPRFDRLSIAVIALLGLPLVARAPADDAPAEKVVLFDGTSLDGWKKTDFSGEGGVKVEDGSIVLGSGKPMTGITSTRKDLPKSGYELSYEAKRLKGNDFFAAATFPVGSSYITLVNGGWSGNITGLSSLDGSDASENETSTYVKFQDATWYAFRVWVTDDAIRAWIDGKKVVEVGIRGRHIGTRIETRANQPLGFATYETSGAVRKVALRRLTPAEIAESRKAVEQ